MKNNEQKEKKEKKKKETKKFPFENTIHSIHNSCDLPNFCYNFLVNPQNLNDNDVLFSSAD